MNKHRIKELAKQADEGYTGSPDVMGHALVGNAAIEKFAELIIRECISVLERPGAMTANPATFTQFGHGWVYSRYLGITHIKEHFGIKT